MTKIYGLKTCDTCRKARKSLTDAAFSDVRETPLSSAQITAFLDAFGDALINRKSTTWRALSEDERAQEPMSLLTQYPTLMKRPVIEGPGGLTLGWTEAIADKYSTPS